MRFGLVSHRSIGIWVKMDLARANFGNIGWFQNNDIGYYWCIQTSMTVPMEE
jgi:hypothetical protein